MLRVHAGPSRIGREANKLLGPRPSPSPHESLQHRRRVFPRFSYRLPPLFFPSPPPFFSLLPFSSDRASAHQRRHRRISCLTFRPPLVFPSPLALPSLARPSGLSRPFFLSLSFLLCPCSSPSDPPASLPQATPYLERSSVQNGQMALSSPSVGEPGPRADWRPVTWARQPTNPRAD